MAAAAAAVAVTGVTELQTAKTTGIRTVRPGHNTTQGRFVIKQMSSLTKTFSKEHKNSQGMQCKLKLEKILAWTWVADEALLVIPRLVK